MTLGTSSFPAVKCDEKSGLWSGLIWSLNPGSPFICLGRLPLFSWFQFLHMKNGSNSSNLPEGLSKD